VSQEKSTKVLARLGQHLHRCRTRSNQVAHCFMGGVWNPNSSQLAGSVQPCQHHSIAPVRFDPIPRFDWDQRRRNNRAGVPEPG
jgi:hypothetical protein